MSLITIWAVPRIVSFMDRSALGWIRTTVCPCHVFWFQSCDHGSSRTACKL
jgi:hypothetical protein